MKPLPILLYILFSLVPGVCFGVNSQPTCEHYWLNGDVLIKSGLPVGREIGPSPYNGGGAYICRLKLTENILTEPYLYIGEVGNASYFKLLTIDGIEAPIIFTHGIDPLSGETPIYTRYLPFIVPMRTIFKGPGDYTFEIRYDSLHDIQTGIRSGPPSLLSLSDCIEKVLIHSPSLSFHFLQFFFLIFTAFSFLFWDGLDIKRRIVFCFCSLFGAFVILQISAIPRSFFEPIYALRMNFIAQFIALPILNYSLTQFYRGPGYPKILRLLYAQCIVAIVGCIVASFTNPEQVYIKIVFAAVLLTLCPLFLLAISRMIDKKALLPNYCILPKKHASIPLILLAALYLFDLINFVLLHNRFYFLNHFFLYSGSALLFRYYLLAEQSNDRRFRQELESIRVEVIKKGAVRSPFFDGVNLYVQGIAKIMHSNRVSVIEFYDDGFKIIGANWSDHSQDLITPFARSEILSRLRQDKVLLIGSGSQASYSSSEFLILPVEQSQAVRAAVASTNFENDNISPFLYHRREAIQYECEITLNLLITMRDNAAQKRLLEMVRLRTHPLQAESEEYFLRSFEMSHQFIEQAFIMGDLVDSTSLNERFGAEVIDKIVDAHLTLVWNKFKHLGIVVSRSKGDSISILAPNLASDLIAADATNRGFEVLHFLAGAEDEFHSICKSHGVPLKIKYRFAMGKASTNFDSKETGSLKSLDLLVGKDLDGAARAISSVALAGECLILESAARLLDKVDSIVRLPEQRVKGKSHPFVVYKVIPIEKVAS